MNRGNLSRLHLRRQIQEQQTSSHAEEILCALWRDLTTRENGLDLNQARVRTTDKSLQSVDILTILRFWSVQDNLEEKVPRQGKQERC